MILHIPHSATKMLDGVEVDHLEENQFVLTDWHTDELFYHESAEPIIFPYSRLSVDVERLKVNEPMDKYGMGILYKKDIFGNAIKRTNEDCMEYYNVHHYKLNQTVNKYLSYFDKVFVVDCHSFPDEKFD
jgi:N-formylglutamate amidohydrolase